MKIKDFPDSENWYWCSTFSKPVEIIRNNETFVYFTGKTYAKVFKGEWVKLENPFE